MGAAQSKGRVEEREVLKGGEKARVIEFCLELAL